VSGRPARFDVINANVTQLTSDMYTLDHQFTSDLCQLIASRFLTPWAPRRSHHRQKASALVAFPAHSFILSLYRSLSFAVEFSNYRRIIADTASAFVSGLVINVGRTYVRH